MFVGKCNFTLFPVLKRKLDIKKLNKEEQFKVIVSESEERIRRICRYYCPSPEDQKDIYQEVMVNIWKSLESFRGDSAISTWVYRVAVNTALTYTGKAFKNMKLFVNGNLASINLVPEEESLKGKLLEEEQLNLLQVELNQLSVIDKVLMSLVLEGLTIKEIAGVIGITEANVKVKIHRVKTQLKEKLNGGNNGC